MAFIARRLTEAELKEAVGSDLFDLTMTFFNQNPMKTTFKVQFIGSKDKLVVYRYREGNTKWSYTATQL